MKTLPHNLLMNSKRKQKLNVGQEKLFNLIVWKLHRKEQTVSQKSVQPRGTGSDFLGKKNVPLPTAHTIFSKGGAYIQHGRSSEPGTLTKPGLRGSHPQLLGLQI